VRIVISYGAGVPLYEQIKDQVKAAVLAGELVDGQMLPSVRALARDLRISVITTTRAYADLAQEGLVANVKGKGAFVLPIDSTPVREQLLRDVEAGFTTALHAARLAGLDRHDVVDMLDTLIAADREPADREPTDPAPTDGEPVASAPAGHRPTERTPRE
jgi:GntR family transcriptional regulator